MQAATKDDREYFPSHASTGQATQMRLTYVFISPNSLKRNLAHNCTPTQQRARKKLPADIKKWAEFDVPLDR